MILRADNEDDRRCLQRQPAPEEVEEARQLVDAFEQDGIAKGLAAIAVDGKMIDTPIYVRARRLLSWAETEGRRA